jgi:DNA repair protein RadC
VDRKLTRELESAASALDIIVHDHIIVGKNTQFSAREGGWLKGKSRG